MDPYVSLTKTAMERAIKVQGVISRAKAKRSRDGRQQKKMAGANGVWKRRGVEKSKNRLSTPLGIPQTRGIPTFPQPRRLRRLTKTGHFICYEKEDINVVRNGNF